jgi:hypothetical protein
MATRWVEGVSLPFFFVFHEFVGEHGNNLLKNTILCRIRWPWEFMVSCSTSSSRVYIYNHWGFSMFTIFVLVQCRSFVSLLMKY